MNFAPILQPNIFIFGITMCGYGVISFLVSNPAMSQAVTIPYRVLVLIINLFLLLFNLGIISPHRQYFSVDNKSKFSEKTVFIFIVIFFFLYSLRIIYDVFIKTDSVLYMEDRSQYIIIWFFITLIPSINFLFLDNSKAKNYLLITWLFYFMVGVLGMSISPETGDEFFAEKGRLAGVALNPISLGGYGVSLAILSLYIWLRQKDLLKILTDKNSNWSFIYLTGISVGVIVVILTASRGPIIQSLALLLLVIFTSGKVDYKTLTTVLLLSITMGLATIYGLNRGSFFIERMFLVGDEYDPTGEGRGNAIELAIKDISENLFTGVGIELKQGGFPHNIIVESFLPFGLIGGTIFVFIFFYAVVKSFKLISDRNSDWSWLGLMFIHQALVAITSGSIYGSSQFWYLLLAIISIDYNVPKLSLHKK